MAYKDSTLKREQSYKLEISYDKSLFTYRKR